MPEVIAMAQEGMSCDALTVCHIRDIYAAFRPHDAATYTRRDLETRDVARLVGRAACTIRDWAKRYKARVKDGPRYRFSLNDVAVMMTEMARPFKGERHDRWTAADIRTLVESEGAPAKNVAARLGRSTRSVHVMRYRLRRRST